MDTFFRDFVLGDKAHKVTILWEDGDPLIKASDVADVLDMSNIREALRGVDDEDKVVKKVDTHGGEQNCVFLKESGLYRIVMRSNKPAARPFQKWMTHVITTLRKEGEYNLQQEMDKMKVHEDHKLAALREEYANRMREEIHQSLLTAADNKPLVYFARLEHTAEDGTMLVKIGESVTLRQRVHSLTTEYGKLHIIKVFQCQQNKLFEHFLHGHPMIKPHKYSMKKILGHEVNEVFAFTDDQLKSAITTACRNVKTYIKDPIAVLDNKVDDVDKKLDGVEDKVDNLQQDVSLLRQDIKMLCESGAKRSSDDAALDSSQPAEAAFPADAAIETATTQPDVILPPAPSKRGNCTKIGHKIQRYNVQGELQETYDNLISVMRDPKLQSSNPGRQCVTDACTYNSVYKGWRWMKLERDQPDSTVQELPPVQERRKVHSGPVVSVNQEKTRVMNVFPSIKALTAHIGFADMANTSRVIKRQKLVADHYYMSWAEVSEEMQQEWLQDNTLPDSTRTHHQQKRVTKLDPATGKVLSVYQTMDEAITKLGVSRVSLRNAINGERLLRGYKFKYTDAAAASTASAAGNVEESAAC